MSEINNSFSFHGEESALKRLHETIKKKHIEKNNLEIFNERFETKNDLVIAFDSHNSVTEFVTKFKKIALKEKIDFYCVITVGWYFDGDYYVYTYSHKDYSLGLYELTPEMKNKVTMKDEYTYVFNGKEYDDSYVPGELFYDMMKFFHGEKIFQFPK